MARAAVHEAWGEFSPLVALAGWSDDQLLTLLAARPDLANPAPLDVAALVARASTWKSIHECAMDLSAGAQQVLEALCLLPQLTTAGALASLLGVDPTSDELGAIINQLADIALVFRVGGKLRVHPELDSLTYPARLGPPVHELFASTQVSVLQEIAGHLGVAAGGTKRQALDALSQALADPERIVRAVRSGPTGTADLVNRLGEHPLEAVPGGVYYVRSGTPVAWLLKCGLVASVDWGSVVMPREVGLALRGGSPFPGCNLRPPPIRWHRIDAAESDRISRQQALEVVADVATILDHWQEAPPKLLKAGGIGVREVRRAAAAVGRSETEAARLIELAAAAGLAGWDGGTDAALPRPAYDEWVTLDGGRRWGVLTAAWLTARLHVSLAGARLTNGKTLPPLLDRWPEDHARRRRQLMLAAWQQGDEGYAPTGDDLAARLTWETPGVWMTGPAKPSILVSWMMEEAAMLGLAASGALSTLGRLVLSGRIDEAVAELTGQAAPLTSTFVVQADMTAVATGQLPGPVRSELELLAALESSGAATVFRFSEASLRRAFDAGRTADQILDFLDAHASKGVPQPLSYLIEDIGRRHGRVRVGSATCYLQSEDPALLTEMLVARRLAKLGLRQLAPTVLVSEATPEVVVETLRANSYLPALEDSTGTVILNRPPILRATSGSVPSKSAGGPMGAEQFSLVLVDPDSRAAFNKSLGDERSAWAHLELEALVRRLRKPSTTGATTASGPVSPPVAAHRANDGTSSAPPAPAVPSISQLQLPDTDVPRPSAIARTDQEIRDLLELGAVTEWLLRLEYTGQSNRTHQLNAAVFDLDGRHVTVGTLPGFGTRTLAVSRIRWARVMTRAEEEALGV